MIVTHALIFSMRVFVVIVVKLLIKLDPDTSTKSYKFSGN